MTELEVLMSIDDRLKYITTLAVAAGAVYLIWKLLDKWIFGGL